MINSKKVGSVWSGQVGSLSSGRQGSVSSGQVGSVSLEFPIVKEVYSGNVLTLYVVMKKDSKSKFAANNWVWGEYEPNGDVYYNVSKKGDACISCHTSGTTRDLTRSFDLH